MTTNDRDAMIRLAISPPADLLAPADLGDAIYREVLATPQRRGIVRLGRLGLGPGAVADAAHDRAARPAGRRARRRWGVPAPEPPLLSMYHGGPDRTGVMPGPGPAGDVTIAWDIQRTGAVAFTSMPLPAGERVFVADLDGMLAALDPGTGATIWQEDVGGAVYGAPALVDGLVVVGTEAGEVVALDVVTGADAWRRELDAGAVLASPLVAGGVIYAGTERDRLFALAPADGHVVWSIETGGGGHARPRLRRRNRLRRDGRREAVRQSRSRPGRFAGGWSSATGRSGRRRSPEARSTSRGVSKASSRRTTSSRWTRATAAKSGPLHRPRASRCTSVPWRMGASTRPPRTGICTPLTRAPGRQVGRSRSGAD